MPCMFLKIFIEFEWIAVICVKKRRQIPANQPIAVCYDRLVICHRCSVKNERRV